MEGNLMLEQYSRYKKMALEESPYKCLLNTHIELNPHQINAFCAAVQALKTGGIVLADEVGLGKTIEAGLVIKHVIHPAHLKIMMRRMLPVYSKIGLVKRKSTFLRLWTRWTSCAKVFPCLVRKLIIFTTSAEKTGLTLTVTKHSHVAARSYISWCPA